jgi:hypothetical protein
MFGSFLAPRLMDGNDSGSGGAANDSVAQQAARKKVQDRKDAFKAAGRQLSSEGDSLMSGAREDAASRIGAVSYRKGGKVRKSKRSEKMMRKSKMRAGVR